MFSVIFYQPIFNLLVFLYNIAPWHDLGIAIVVLTVIIKLVFWPLNQKSFRSQRALAKLQPQIEELKKQYKDDQQGLGRAMMVLYRESKVNPASSCLPILIQLPFLIALFEVFRNGLKNGSLDRVYQFIYRPEFLNPIAFGFFSLDKPSIPLALISGAAQFIAGKMLITKQPAKVEGSKDESMAAIMNKQMQYTMPIITVVIGATMPAGLTLYWLVSTLMTILQQVIALRKEKKIA